MATLEQIKQANNFYTITVTADIDDMQYVRSRNTLHPETDDVTLLLVYGRYWRNDDIYETLQTLAKDVLTDDELESIGSDTLDELIDMLFEGLEDLIPYYVGDIIITKAGNEYKLNVTEDDIRNIFLSNV